ncbi:hypothetical protein YERSI8AC_10263 [Enterobacterales bacterium 8AC]|nr:hypothetical protein YERSI8AC_10263 [Enterobacterales bacterium 8AC]
MATAYPSHANPFPAGEGKGSLDLSVIKQQIALIFLTITRKTNEDRRITRAAHAEGKKLGNP